MSCRSNFLFHNLAVNTAAGYSSSLKKDAPLSLSFAAFIGSQHENALKGIQ